VQSLLPLLLLLLLQLLEWLVTAPGCLCCQAILICSPGQADCLLPLPLSAVNTQPFHGKLWRLGAAGCPFWAPNSHPYAIILSFLQWPQDRDDGRLSGFLVAWHSFHLTSRVYVYFGARRASPRAFQASQGLRKGASSHSPSLSSPLK